jgi:hypothetical protein
MYCKSHKATLAIRICIRRQEIARERKINGDPLSTFSKCYSCSIGKKIQLNPDPRLDFDIRRMLIKYNPKPKKHRLSIDKPLEREEVNKKFNEYRRNRKIISTNITKHAGARF